MTEAEEPERPGDDPEEHPLSNEPYDWDLLWMSIAVFVGTLVFLAGASSLAAALFFPDVAFAGGPLQDRGQGLQVLASLLVLLAGLALAGVPIARGVRAMWEVRKREDATDDEP